MSDISSVGEKEDRHIQVPYHLRQEWWINLQRFTIFYQSYGGKQGSNIQV